MMSIICFVINSYFTYTPKVIAANESNTVGDFSILGGTLDVDYTYDSDTLTIKTNTPITISNTNQDSFTNNKILMKNNIIDLTLDNVNMNYGIDTGDNILNLTLKENSKNILNKSMPSDTCGIRIGQKGTLVINGKGELTAYGAWASGGIGSTNAGSHSNSGTLIINDGIINSIGNHHGSAIGGRYWIDNITINGGVITTSGDAYGGAIGPGENMQSGKLYLNGGVINSNIRGNITSINYYPLPVYPIFKYNISNLLTGKFSSLVRKQVSEEDYKNYYYYSSSLSLPENLIFTYGEINEHSDLKGLFGITTDSSGALSYQYKEINGDYKNFPLSKYLDVGEYVLKVNQEEDDNHLSTESIVDFTVLPKEITLSGLQAQDKTYDGNNLATINKNQNFLINGRLEKHTENEVDISGFTDNLTVGTFENKNVQMSGEEIIPKNVTITGLNLSGTESSNYTLILPTDLTSKIIPKEISFSTIISDKNYDGTETISPQPTAKLNASDIIYGDENNISLSNGTATFADISIGTHNIIFKGYQLTGSEKNNYTLVLPTISATINQGFNPVKGIHYEITSVQDGLDNWYKNNNFIITAKDGYMISKNNTDTGPWSSSIIEEADTIQKNIIFYVRRTGEKDGNILKNEISQSTSESYRKDSSSPTGVISIGENKWTSFLNWITFGYFFKETINVKITAGDSISGIREIKYLISEIPYENIEDIINQDWISYETTIVRQSSQNEKFSIYSKLIDNAGNISIINTDGIVVYKDSSQGTKSISFTKTNTHDISASTTLNGNTISKITNGENTLILNTDYKIEDSLITFKSTYLDSLSAGNYNLIIYYNPAGENYISGTSIGDAPSTTSIELTVSKAVQSSLGFDNLFDNYTYGDHEIILETIGGSGTGNVNYYLTTNDGLFTFQKM